MSADPRLIRAILSQPDYLELPLMTTALIESGGRLSAVGDSGHSYGPFQEYDQGRGAGLTPRQRMDPVGATQRAAREFATFYQRGARGASLAYRAQRPADQQGYMARYQSLLPEAQRILAAARGGQAPNTIPTAGDAPSIEQAGMAPGGAAAMIAALRSLRRPGADRIAGLQQLMALRGQGAPGQAAAPGASPAAAGGGGGGLAPILPGQAQWGSYGYSDPEGQGGRHLAVDWFGEHGVEARSPVTGRVVRLSQDPNAGGQSSGQVFGGTLGIRDPSGRLFVLRHIDPNGQLRQGASVTAGQGIGTPADWTGKDHIHLEVYRPGSGDREYRPGYALNPRQVYRQGGLFR